ncbi:MAG: glycosyltransferase family 2 protein [Ignavibacteria bacterium]|nr:glycosyltransferase family 2 protein [Ignavibacteria bacterium]
MEIIFQIIIYIIKASVIIVNYNGKKFLKDCFDSLMKQSFTDFQIVFVDNNSGDGSVEFIKENYPSDKIKIIISDKNLGFAGGNNLGYKNCEGEYIVLLNNDTTVDKDWLKNLIDCISADANIGMAQSLVLTEGIPGKYYEMNGTVNLLGHNIMEIFEIGKDGLGEIFLAGGCSLIIRRSLADELNGLFLDEYFAYSEKTLIFALR